MGKASSVPPHPHDEMYLVFNFRNGDGPDYFSCHHCRFIKVPEIATLQGRVKEFEDEIERVADYIERHPDNAMIVVPILKVLLTPTDPRSVSESVKCNHDIAWCLCTPEEKTEPPIKFSGCNCLKGEGHWETCPAFQGKTEPEAR